MYRDKLLKKGNKGDVKDIGKVGAKKDIIFFRVAKGTRANDLNVLCRNILVTAFITSVSDVLVSVEDCIGHEMNLCKEPYAFSSKNYGGDYYRTYILGSERTSS